MEGLIKYNFAEPDATGVATDNIDEMISFNQAETARRQGERFGTIQAPPEQVVSNEDLLNMVTGNYGGAIGKIGRAAVTGGQAIAKTTSRLLRETGNKGGVKAFEKAVLDRILADNKISTAKQLMEKALNKWGIRHTKTLNDPVTEILRAYKHRKN